MKSSSNKFLKGILAVVMGLMLVLSMGLFAACGSGEETETPGPVGPSGPGEPTEDKAEVAEYYFSGAAGAQVPCFFHFYEDGTYYAVLYGGAFKDAGTYELVEEDLEYMDKAVLGEVDPTTGQPREKWLDPASKKTADSYIQLTSYGDVLTYNWLEGENDQALLQPTDKLPLDGEGNIVVGTSMSCIMTFEADDAYGDPGGVESNFRYEVVKFYADNNANKMLVLYHDHTYDDMTDGVIQNGTWTEGAENTYTLKNDITEEEKTLTVHADGTAVYGDLTLADVLTVDRSFTGTLGSVTVDEDTMDVLGQAFSIATTELTLACNAAEGTYTLGGNLVVPQMGTFPFTMAGGTYTEEPDPAFGGFIPKFTFTSSDESIVITAVAVPGATDATYTLTIVYTKADVTVTMSPEMVLSAKISGTATATATIPFSM